LTNARMHQCASEGNAQTMFEPTPVNARKATSSTKLPRLVLVN